MLKTPIPRSIPISIPIKTRGAGSSLPGRFDATTTEPYDDGWAALEEPDLPRVSTTVSVDHVRTIITQNASPDIPFTQSINPFQGCEHGCIYCYARPSHAYWNLSPGIDFETRLFYKANAATLLERELRRPGYRCTPISLGTNTDPYQPIERTLRVTRGLLEVLLRFQHPVTIVTKGAALIGRDLDILTELAATCLVRVAVSLTTFDDRLKRTMEPRAAAPAARVRVIQKLFREWLETHAPLKAKHVTRLIQQTQGGRDYDARWGIRQRGVGASRP